MRSFLLLTVVFGLTRAFPASNTSEAVHVRSSRVEGRIWQAKIPKDRTIRWRWNGASSAVLTVVSRLNRVALEPMTFIAAADAQYGHWVLPERTEGEDAAYDLTLDLYADGSLRETLQASIVDLSDSWTLRVPGTRGWKRIAKGECRVVPYDANWQEETEDAVSAKFECSVRGGQAATVPLNGISGWECLDVEALLPGHTGDFSVTLTYDDVAVSDARLRYGLPGLLLYVQ